MKKVTIVRYFSLVVALFFLLGAGNDATACTSAIITGKATADGRPLMWKHRDTSNENNRVVYSSKGKYAYIGLVNSEDVQHNEIWSGTNSAGFCIMNTASYNLKDLDDKTREADAEGLLMRMALECCATLADFERFLDTLPKPMKVEANFGVIDAQGGAAYYETNNYRYFKADANDPMLAPQGYLIRTNYSYSGRINEGMGYIRHESAAYIFSQLIARGGTFTPEWLFASADRSYYHSFKGADLKDYDFSAPGATGFVVDQDYIPRYTTSASIVFQGVKPGELAEHTVMWTVLGFPSCSVAMPLLVKGGEALPSLLVKAKDSNNAPLCDKALALKAKVFSVERGNGKKYFNWKMLYNPAGKGIMQQLAPVEQAVFDKSYAAMSRWGAGSWTQSDIHQLYKEVNTTVGEAYKQLFDL